MKIRLSKTATTMVAVIMVATLWPVADTSTDQLRDPLGQVSPRIDLVSEIGGRSFGIDTQGEFAYLTVGNSVLVLNISDPSMPTLVGESGNLGDAPWIENIVVDGDYAYAVNIDELSVIDISNPTDPIVVGTIRPGRGLTDLAVQGSYVYVGTSFPRDSGFYVIDVSDPSQPQLAGSADVPTQRLDVSGSYAYVMSAFEFAIIDISDPTSPSVIGTFDRPPFAHYRNILYSDGLLFIAGDGRSDTGLTSLTIFDVSNPSNPIEVGGIGSGTGPSALYVVGGLVYQAISGTLRVIDVSDPAASAEVGSVQLPDRALNLVVAGNLAYLADSLGGLRIIDVSDPTSLEELGRFTLPALSVGVFVEDDVAYIADGINGLLLLDISSPSDPVLVSMVDTPEFAQKVFVAGNFAYVADGSGLVIFNILDTTNPQLVGRYDTQRDALGIFVSGSYAYLAVIQEGLLIIDVSDPSSPQLIGRAGTNANAVYVLEPYAYVADFFSDQLLVIDVSVPENPLVTGTNDEMRQPHDVHVVGEYAYIIDDGSGTAIPPLLRTFDISDPTDPLQISSHELFGRAFAVDVVDNLAYTIGNGLRIVDVSDPASPNDVADHRTFGRDIHVLGEHIYVAAVEAGFQIFRFTGGTEPPTVDLSISDSDITPIQVVEGANINGDDRIDLVQGKPLVVRVRPGITGGTALNPAAEVDVAVSFLGVIQTQKIPIGSLVSDPSTYLDFRFSPFQSGDAEVFATVDVSDDFAESDEQNNSAFVPVTVKDTKGLSLYHFLVIDRLQREPKDVGNTAAEGGRFVSWIFPVAMSEFTNGFSPKPFRSSSIVAGELALNQDGWDMWERAMKESGGVLDRVIAIVPQEYLDFHLRCPGAAGTIRGKVAYVVGGEWTTSTHELGHSYGMFTVTEEYTAVEEPPLSCQGGVVDPGPFTDGYNVELMEPVEDALDFMGASLGPQRLDHWITRGNFEFLFGHKEFLVDPGDPELLLVSGHINLDGSITLGQLDRLVQGVPDTDQEGDYSVGLIDVDGNEVASASFDVSFVLHMDPYPIQPGETGVFMLALPYHEDALTIEFQLGDEVITSVDISTALLHDAVASIPDAAFENNPDQRRSALYNKINALRSQIESEAFQGATKKLENDIIPSLEMWLIDDYPTDDVLQYSKGEILDLAIRLMTRMEAMK